MVLFLFCMHSDYSARASFTTNPLGSEQNVGCMSIVLIDRWHFVLSVFVQPSCHSAGSSTNSPLSSRWTWGALSPRSQETSTSPRWTPRTVATTPASLQVRLFPRACSPTTSPSYLWLNVSNSLPNVCPFFPHKLWLHRHCFQVSSFIGSDVKWPT